MGRIKNWTIRKKEEENLKMLLCEFEDLNEKIFHG